jgi:hypothetical protein
MGKEPHITDLEIAAGAEFAKNRLESAIDNIAEEESGAPSSKIDSGSNYRAYIVGHDGHFKTFEVITADDDESAIKSARKYVDGHDVEVWDLDRKVAVLSHIK